MKLIKKSLSSSLLVFFFVLFQLGSTAIGIQTNEGVVLAVEKRVTSPLIEPTSIEKILEVDEHIGNSNLSLWTWNVMYKYIFVIEMKCMYPNVV